MKIDEASINHNAVRLIKEMMPFEMCDDADERLRTMALGYIDGVCAMADELKKVLAE